MDTELSLEVDGIQVVISNALNYTRNSVDNTEAFDREFILNGDREYLESRHSVKVTASDGTEYSCVLFAGGGSTTIHNHSAVIVNDNLVVAVGDHVCSLNLPDLEMHWMMKADSVTCFGVHHSVLHQCYVVHGECEISRFEYNGEKRWEMVGRDIFTGDFAVNDDFIVAEDFNGKKYKIDIGTGSSLL